MEPYVLIGVAAGILSLVPQIPSFVRLVRESKFRKMTFVTFASLFLSLGLWVIYGILKSDWIIAISSSAILILYTGYNLLAVYYTRRSIKNERYFFYSR
jgi:MtN3 and saliva related transmembrane protein